MLIIMTILVTIVEGINKHAYRSTQQIDDVELEDPN